MNGSGRIHLDQSRFSGESALGYLFSAEASIGLWVFMMTIKK